ncbi:MAG: hypothetical protein Q9165_004129 [Trypethelium subeluteriae]
MTIPGSSVYAQIAQQCQQAACYSLNIPEETGATGKGDIYFQVSAPTSNSWVALGQGSHMAGSSIFVVYTSSDGKNVTLSPRAGVGHVEPEFSSGPQVTLLNGSGVSNGSMTANIKCSNCDSWSGGTMDFTSNSGTWIWAVRSGPALNSDLTDQSILQHSEEGSFAFDFTKARGGNDVNPFTNASATIAPGSSSGGSGASGGDTGPDSTFTANPQRSRNIIIAHGVMASLALVIFFPLGAVVIRALNISGLTWLHAALQTFAYVVYIPAVGLGCWIAVHKRYLNEHHPAIGLAIFILLILQPIFGSLHHNAFKKHGGRSIWSHAHIWLGRVIITLGMINGGLGLLLAGNASRGQQIAYGVVAGIVWVAYVISAIFGEANKAKVAQAGPSQQSSKFASSGGETGSWGPTSGGEQVRKG